MERTPTAIIYHEDEEIESGKYISAYQLTLSNGNKVTISKEKQIDKAGKEGYAVSFQNAEGLITYLLMTEECLVGLKSLVETVVLDKPSLKWAAKE